MNFIKQRMLLFFLLVVNGLIFSSDDESSQESWQNRMNRFKDNGFAWKNKKQEQVNKQLAEIRQQGLDLKDQLIQQGKGFFASLLSADTAGRADGGTPVPQQVSTKEDYVVQAVELSADTRSLLDQQAKVTGIIVSLPVPKKESLETFKRNHEAAEEIRQQEEAKQQEEIRQQELKPWEYRSEEGVIEVDWKIYADLSVERVPDHSDDVNSPKIVPVEVETPKPEDEAEYMDAGVESVSDGSGSDVALNAAEEQPAGPAVQDQALHDASESNEKEQDSEQVITADNPAGVNSADILPVKVGMSKPEDEAENMDAGVESVSDGSGSDVALELTLEESAGPAEQDQALHDATESTEKEQDGERAVTVDNSVDENSSKTVSVAVEMSKPEGEAKVMNSLVEPVGEGNDVALNAAEEQPAEAAEVQAQALHDATGSTEKEQDSEQVITADNPAGVNSADILPVKVEMPKPEGEAKVMNSLVEPVGEGNDVALNAAEEQPAEAAVKDQAENDASGSTEKAEMGLKVNNGLRRFYTLFVKGNYAELWNVYKYYLIAGGVSVTVTMVSVGRYFYRKLFKKRVKAAIVKSSVRQQSSKSPLELEEEDTVGNDSYFSSGR